MALTLSRVRRGQQEQKQQLRKLGTDQALDSNTTELHFYLERADGSVKAATGGSSPISIRLSSEDILELFNGTDWEAVITPDDRMLGDWEYILDVSDSSLDGVTIGMSTKEDDPNGVVSSYVTSNGTAAGLDGAKITLSIPKSELGKTYYLFAEKDSAVIEGAGGALTVGTRSAAIDVTGSVDVVSDLKKAWKSIQSYLPILFHLSNMIHITVLSQSRAMVLTH